MTVVLYQSFMQHTFYTSTDLCKGLPAQLVIAKNLLSFEKYSLTRKHFFLDSLTSASLLYIITLLSKLV